MFWPTTMGRSKVAELMINLKTIQTLKALYKLEKSLKPLNLDQLLAVREVVDKQIKERRKGNK